LYQDDGRNPYSSINFVVAHDGFTLNDLVSYEQKHNEANGEENRDGNDNNRSANYGVEGPTDDPQINAVRQQQMRNFWRRCCSHRACPCFAAAMKSPAPNGGTTMPTARTTSSAGTTGRWMMRASSCWNSRAN
jgi:hypothetical protein